jgi:hypothetical protein
MHPEGILMDDPDMTEDQIDQATAAAEAVKLVPPPLEFSQGEVKAAILFLAKLGGTPDPTLAGRIRDAVFIADTEDVTEWQRGYRACANRVLYELDTAPQVEWTPPPPGDTREQLPDHILELIRPYLKDYQSSACETAYAIAQRLYAPSSHTDEEDAELRLWQGRMQERCRENQKYTGQLCVHPHHDRQTT